jgi:ABC-2 type transport system ATP-binding protein
LIAAADHDVIARLEGVGHRFGRAEALCDVSLEIRRGDIYGLLGLNGAGKTTALRILLGLLRRRAGRVSLFGEPAGGLGSPARGRIGATIEGPAFYPHLTGRTNLTLLHRLGGGRGRGAEEALAMTGLSAAADLKARKYSMGMRQRLHLAQALLGEPEFLVLDEPTSNLDPRGIADVRETILRLNRESGVTVLLSSHQLSEVQSTCGRVGILHRGRKVLESSVEDLFADERSEMEIEVDRPEAAAEFLRSFDWVSGARVESGRVRASVKRGERARLNSRLVAGGFAASELRERRPSLEDLFHQKIAGSRAEASAKAGDDA